eukprot:CAMPEP_0115548594 /NCGR_PEP_ID=MMETSP0271-20121206/94245_1 /TAXON_ID=71861 /ORGANISM="Scrippsiella trochoidea, Strain CCMP3099" /LENGTH=75 /DNA_ID=CAMNT_0002982067 /DNA_START=120 /DNA_END=343 /DNA_ORIENTATION=+
MSTEQAAYHCDKRRIKLVCKTVPRADVPPAAEMAIAILSVAWIHMCDAVLTSNQTKESCSQDSHGSGYEARAQPG